MIFRLLFLLVLGLTTSECSLRMSSSTDDTTITCNFSLSNEHDMTRLFSLTISKASSRYSPFNELITINALKPNDAEASENFNGSLEGQITTDGQWDSYLQAEYPEGSSEYDAGEYTCGANGFDDFNRPVTVKSNTLSVNDGVCRENELNARIEELEKQLRIAKKNVPTCAPCNCGQTSVTSLRKFREETEDKLDRNRDVKGVSEIFASSSFYILTKSRITLEQALKLCKDNRGYLAEINSKAEYRFVTEWMSDDMFPYPDRGVYDHDVNVGAFYKDLSAPFEPYTHKSDPLYLAHWKSEYPRRESIDSNFLALYMEDKHTWFMVDNSNQGSRSTKSYLCEVSLKYL